jgi:D-alanyl-D-alanine carboxypeptidase
MLKNSSPASTDPIDIMQQHLKPKGENPVHSIQIYLSDARTAFHEAVGFADGVKEKADLDNQFKIASITKMMTSLVVLQMQEEGLLHLEDSAAQYLSGVKFARMDEIHFFAGKPYGNTLSLRQLLQHRSGLADIFTDASFRFYLDAYLHKKREWNPEKLMNRYYHYNLNKKAHFIPDGGFHYSDVNYFLLGLIIEKLSGQTLAQQFRSRIFKPLKMENTYFEYYEPACGNGKLAHSFLSTLDITKSMNTSYDWAGGGVVSTTKDLAVFLHGLFDLKLFAQVSTLDSMLAVVANPQNSGRVSYYGLGIYRFEIEGDTFYGHAGFWGAQIAYCPEKRITFCGSINQVNAPFSTTQFVTKLLKAFLANDY